MCTRVDSKRGRGADAAGVMKGYSSVNVLSRMDCPDETTLSDFLDGLLPAEQRERVLEHVERCSECQWLVALGASDAGPEPESRPGAPLPPGATLSRYVVLERIGQGAMGVVYAAHDPELARKVALKVLRPEGLHVEELRQRLLREAQALARLAHPHVVTVHDVGTCDGAIFLAMELVEGTTLARWLEQPRPWREVLRVFREAGQGLAAAHAAGLVHRDFKPANVLVGLEGRARVTDFGLASTSSEPSPSPTASPSHAGARDVSGSLTRTGALVGTPAYMAPEQLRGRGASALSDQFSFCVALHEALHGERPFEGSTLEELALAALEGRVRTPERASQVPAWVRRAVLRGLRPRPEERFPSMQALVAALTPRASRRRTWVTLSLGVASVLGGLLGYRMAHRHEALCARDSQRLAVAWSPEHRERARAAFLATGVSTAEPIWRKVSAVLDAYAARWDTLRTQACIAAAGDTTSTAWQTASCLDTRLWQLAAVTDALGKADTQTIHNAPQMMASLEGLDGCLDAPSSAMRPQPTEALRPRVDAVRRRLAEAQALQELAKHAEGLAVTSSLLQELPDIGYRPLEAEVLSLHGFLLSLSGKPKEAEQVLQQAVWAAEAGRDDEMAVRAWTLLVRVQGLVQGRIEDATRSAQHARAVLERLGRERYPALASNLHMRMGDLELLQMRLEPAVAEFTRALELARKTFGAEHPRTGALLHKLGNVRFEQLRYEEALVLYLQANTLWERAWGADSGPIAVNLSNIASARLMLGRLDEALADYQRALRLLEIYHPPDHPSLGPPHISLGTLLVGLGRVDEAREHFLKSLAIFERSSGRDHPDTVMALTALGGVAADTRRFDEAFAYHTEALARVERSLGPDSPQSVVPLEYLGRALLQAGRVDEARLRLRQALAVVEKHHGPEDVSQASPRRGLARLELSGGAPRLALAQCQRALALDERVQGPQVPDVALDLACLGEAHLALGEAARAVPLLERARLIHQHAPQDRRDAAWAAFLLARALEEGRGAAERGRALALAEEARELLAAQKPRGQSELRQVTAWLSARRRAHAEVTP